MSGSHQHMLMSGSHQHMSYRYSWFMNTGVLHEVCYSPLLLAAGTGLSNLSEKLDLQALPVSAVDIKELGNNRWMLVACLFLVSHNFCALSVFLNDGRRILHVVVFVF
jgi:hypothetical protein